TYNVGTVHEAWGTTTPARVWLRSLSVSVRKCCLPNVGSPSRRRATEPCTLGCIEDVDLAVGKGQVQLQVTDVGIAAHHVRVRPRTVGRRGLGSQRQDAASSLDRAPLGALDGAVRRRLALGERVLVLTVRR